ncbi:MAG: D-glycero-alpha-D-manno-heptose-7-phosphate kinase [Actinomycetota bacterium]|jgi:D-glycero-alpha-D-manno-heptose-7-phosphate kinase|nr:D-glycero-alpha-D-manno-heptose-7-phosphate kinase [Actinomycetota bacterium]
MIITRTPMRISLGGGGTDLPSHYRVSGGFLVAAAISRHVYIAVNQNFDDDILLKYSQVEHVTRVSDIRHPLLREALRLTGVERRVEISSMADIPANTGLGSSGSFTVGVLKALHAHQRRLISNRELAEQACHIEIDRLGEPVGKQDQYIAALGGVTSFRFHPDDSVEVVPVPMSEDTRWRLEENLLLFYTGQRRSASEVLADQDAKSKAGHPETSSNLGRVTEIGQESFQALVTGDLPTFAKLMTLQWELKRQRSPSATNLEIDAWINTGLKCGASGGKLVGAGGGGFLLFYSEAKADLRAAMARLGLPEVRFSFDYEGSALVVV